jgi:hypothetical protein
MFWAIQSLPTFFIASKNGTAIHPHKLEKNFQAIEIMSLV